MKNNLTQKLLEKYLNPITEEKDSCASHGSFVKAYEQMKKAQAEKNNENNEKKLTKMVIER